MFWKLSDRFQSHFLIRYTQTYPGPHQKRPVGKLMTCREIEYEGIPVLFSSFPDNLISILSKSSLTFFHISKMAYYQTRNFLQYFTGF